MSALTGCIAGADATGLIDPNRRADAYTTCTNNMATILGSTNAVKRADAKRSVMHTFYGSKKTPIDLFGEDTPELKAFYEAAEAMAPGPWELLQDLLASWNPYALSHEWKLPDGFDAKVKVMAKREVRIEVDELEHATFTYEFYENVGSERGLSNAANMVHSMDAWILRSMHRRLNYNPVVIRAVSKHLAQEFDDRLMGSQQEEHTKDDEFAYYVEQYNRSTLVDATILPYINAANVSCLSDDHLNKLLSMVDGMLKHKPFELVTVHDESTIGSAA